MDNCQFFDTYLQYWEGSPVIFLFSMKLGGANPVSTNVLVSIGPVLYLSPASLLISDSRR